MFFSLSEHNKVTLLSENHFIVKIIEYRTRSSHLIQSYNLLLAGNNKMAPEGAWYKKLKKKKRFCPYNTASDNPILIFNEYEIQYFGKELKILRIAM